MLTLVTLADVAHRAQLYILHAAVGSSDGSHTIACQWHLSLYVALHMPHFVEIWSGGLQSLLGRSTGS